MATPRFLALLILVLAAAILLSAQDAVTERLVGASALNDEGNFRAALNMVEPLLQSKTSALSEAALGVAWTLRGLALENLGQTDEARRSYESAIHLLRNIPEQQGQYAAALDNLGALLAEVGQLENSKSLRLQARKLYELLNDHAGTARTSTGLALVAIGQGKVKEARRLLGEAFREESLVPIPKAGDVAWMESAQCLQYEHEGNPRSALAAIGGAIELWTREYGPKYYLLIAAYSMRGRAYEMLHDFQSAMKDMQAALGLQRGSPDGDRRLYFLTEISYARVLRHAGMTSEATQMESEARAALDDLERRQCRGCTINAASLR